MSGTKRPILTGTTDVLNRGIRVSEHVAANAVTAPPPVEANSVAQSSADEDRSTPCGECSEPTKRSSGLCRRCDPARKTARERKQDSKADCSKGSRKSAQDLVDDIEAGVAQVVTGDDWKRYLDVQGQFHNYSFNNVMLIMIQRPDATAVAGFRKWQGMGRQVNGGEKGIRILAPSTRKEVDEETGEEKRVMRGFRAVSVFDVSQTSGEPLPEPPARQLEGEAPAEMFDALDAHATELGVGNVRVVRPADDPLLQSGANGYARRHDDGSLEIVLRSDISDAQRAKTYAHEIGHVAMGHLDEPGVDSVGHKLRADKELEAESFAYMVTNSWGVDSGDYTFGYTATWSNGDTKRVREAATNVSTSVRPFLRADLDVGMHA